MADTGAFLRPVWSAGRREVPGAYSPCARLVAHRVTAKTPCASATPFRGRLSRAPLAHQCATIPARTSSQRRSAIFLGTSHQQAPGSLNAPDRLPSTFRILRTSMPKSCATSSQQSRRDSLQLPNRTMSLSLQKRPPGLRSSGFSSATISESTSACDMADPRSPRGFYSKELMRRDPRPPRSRHRSGSRLQRAIMARRRTSESRLTGIGALEHYQQRATITHPNRHETQLGRTLLALWKSCRKLPSTGKSTRSAKTHAPWQLEKPNRFRPAVKGVKV